MKKHWREWFALANTIVWQGIDISEGRVQAFIDGDRSNCTETMYHAFKARFIEEVMGDASTRKDEGCSATITPSAKALDVPSTPHDQQREISVLNPQDDGFLPCPFCGGCGEPDMHPSTANGTIKCADCHARAHKEDWNKRQLMPVSVSLSKCVHAVTAIINAGGPSLSFNDDEIAKAVLDAAGVKYVD